jgi:predicted porin
MKNKIIATLVAFGLVGSASAIEINENLSINGFIDTSYTHNENEVSGDKQELGLDEIELNFLFNVGGASGAIHVDRTDGRDPVASDVDAGINLEQAFIGYSLENGVSFTLGKYGSELGFEREDAGGLYTFSRAYGGLTGGAFNLGDVDENVYEGIRLGYSSDVFGLGISLQNDAGQPEDIENNELDLEVSFAYTGIENLNIGGGYRFENAAGSTSESDVLNIHVTTVMGKFLLGAEYIEIENAAKNAADQDLDGWTVIADYDVSDKLGVALRISSNELDGDNDYEKVTIAPNYSLSDSLGVILEYSDVDLGSGKDANELALELTFTF